MIGNREVRHDMRAMFRYIAKLEMYEVSSDVVLSTIVVY